MCWRSSLVFTRSFYVVSKNVHYILLLRALARPPCCSRYYVEEMANKMDQSRIHDFFAVLRDACPLVDEANEITRHMLAHQNLKSAGIRFVLRQTCVGCFV